MNKIETFQQFLATQSAQIPVLTFVFSLLLAALLAYILGRIYIRYGASISNRRMFANNFIILSMTTMLIITIVKSSLALSLGLVGALSIVRFRAAIKEPEELAYLFLCIAIGLGLGADQVIITLVAFAIMCFLFILRAKYRSSKDEQNLFLTVTSDEPNLLKLDDIIKTLRKYCSEVDVKRFDETEKILESSFYVKVSNFDGFNNIRSELQTKNKSVRIAFLDNKGM